MAQFILRPAAYQDLNEIRRYINRTASRERSRAVVRKINETMQLYATQPNAGSKRDNLLPGLRSFVVHSYIIFYFPVTNGIDVTRIIQGSRNLTEIEF